MFTVTNSGKAPRIFTDRFGMKRQINPGETLDDLDFDQDTGDYIAELQKMHHDTLSISGEADTSDKPKQGPKSEPSILRKQTLGNPVAMPQRGPQAPAQPGAPPPQKFQLPPREEVEDMKRTEVDELAVRVGLNPEDYRKKEDLIEAMYPES